MVVRVVVHAPVLTLIVKISGTRNFHGGPDLEALLTAGVGAVDVQFIGVGIRDAVALDAVLNRDDAKRPGGDALPTFPGSTFGAGNVAPNSFRSRV